MKNKLERLYPKWLFLSYWIQAWIAIFDNVVVILTLGHVHLSLEMRYICWWSLKRMQNVKKEQEKVND
jgi:hypothetical protein